jgi:hypothetical protein
MIKLSKKNCSEPRNDSRLATDCKEQRQRTGQEDIIWNEVTLKEEKKTKSKWRRTANMAV